MYLKSLNRHQIHRIKKQAFLICISCAPDLSSACFEQFAPWYYENKSYQKELKPFFEWSRRLSLSVWEERLIFDFSLDNNACSLSVCTLLRHVWEALFARKLFNPDCMSQTIRLTPYLIIHLFMWKFPVHIFEFIVNVQEILFFICHCLCFSLLYVY